MLAPITRRRRLISLTPLIDVVFILLLFFMLASSFADRRSLSLAVPDGHAEHGRHMQGTLYVRILGDGSLRLGSAAVTLKELRARVSERVAAGLESRVVVSASDGVALQRVVTTLDALAAAGADDVTLLEATARDGDTR